MALSPLSPSHVSRPSCRSSSAESVSTPTPASPDLQGSRQDNLLRRLLATDNFRSSSGDGAAATLGEVKFDGSGGQTYYDVSYIEGDNASMTIQPESGGKKSGTEKDLLASAPDSIKARDANGHVYGIKKTTTSNVQDPSVVDFYRKHVGADEGYVIPTDDASTLATKDSHLVVHMKNRVSP
jgi:hypothetical protein